jgi:hypothetical protein
MSASWPAVRNEDETLDAVLSGKGIARFGDGEFNICLGGNCVSQKFDKKLSEELKSILYNGAENCIVGTVRRAEGSPKNWFWDNIVSREKVIKLHNPKLEYYSSFISRPDSAPWINNEIYWNKLFSLWKGKDVTLVAGSGRSLTPEKLHHAKSVRHIEATYRDSYDVIDRLEKECIAANNNIVILCCGATASVLAARLSKKSFHALDLGHIGMFKKHYDQFNIS